MREPWYVAYKAHGGMTMKILKTKRIALKAATELLQECVAGVEAGPMLDTHEGILSGEALRRIAGRT